MLKRINENNQTRGKVKESLKKETTRGITTTWKLNQTSLIKETKTDLTQVDQRAVVMKKTA